jgi:hypothetical protein
MVIMHYAVLELGEPLATAEIPSSSWGSLSLQREFPQTDLADGLAVIQATSITRALAQVEFCNVQVCATASQSESSDLLLRAIVPGACDDCRRTRAISRVKKP